MTATVEPKQAPDSSQAGFEGGLGEVSLLFEPPEVARDMSRLDVLEAEPLSVTPVQEREHGTGVGLGRVGVRQVLVKNVRTRWMMDSPGVLEDGREGGAPGEVRRDEGEVRGHAACDQYEIGGSIAGCTIRQSRNEHRLRSVRYTLRQPAHRRRSS